MKTRSQTRNDSVDLLPGIPNEITLDLISPKLPWRTFHILSSVSSGWRRAIQSRQVYDARRRSHSTETLVLIGQFTSGDGRWIGLCSVKEKTFYRLPGIPGVDLGISMAIKCISLDGKVYVLGGSRLDYDKSGPYGIPYPSCSMYVMDLTGQKHWKQCASMKCGRHCFGSGVHNGKIYVCGGISVWGAACRTEVYDPDLNVWSPYQSMMSYRADSQVAALGNEVLVHGGGVVKQHLNPIYRGISFSDIYFLVVYNPVSDEWRKVEDPASTDDKILFTAQGKIHSISKLGIQVYDFDKKSWIDEHSFSLSALEPANGGAMVDLATPLATDNEVLRLMDCHADAGVSLLQSVGFSNRNERIVWQKIECTFPLLTRGPFPIVSNPFMCIVQL